MGDVTTQAMLAIGQASIQWRALAEQMEAQRDEALANLAAATARAERAEAALRLYTNDEYWMHGEWMGPGGVGDISRHALGEPVEDWSQESIERALAGERGEADA